MNCCMCGKEIEGNGHDPDPCSQVGRCCDSCYEIVLLYRKANEFPDIFRVPTTEELHEIFNKPLK